MSLLPRIVLLISFFLAVVAQDLANTTVQATDSSVIYSGDWPISQEGPCAYKNTTGIGATVSFTFRGVAIRVRGNFRADMVPQVRLDNAQARVNPSQDNLQCGGTVFQQSGLADTEHTVVLTATGPTGAWLAITNIVYSVPGPSSSSLQSSTRPTQSSANPTQPSGVAGQTSSSPSGHSKGLSKGGIAGVSVGAAVAAVAGLAILGFLASKHAAHALEGLLLLGLGWKARRLIFKAPKSLAPTQISIFLTSHGVLEDVDKEGSDKPVVWQTFNIGGATQEFAVDIPSLPTGNVKLGFATLDAKDEGATVVQCRTVGQAPARLVDGDEWEHEGSDETEIEPPAKKKNSKERPKLTAKNTSGFGTRIALGTYHEDNAKVQPLLLVENFHEDGVYEAPEEFYLHAFRTNAYSAGQYGKTIFKDAFGDRLTSEGGIQLSKLSPLTSWYIESDKNGKLTLRIGRTSRKDRKSFKHECKISNDAAARNV